MKKSKLIKLLTEIQGDPDILIWNGQVGDWHDIGNKLIESDLVRETFEYACTSLKHERAVELQDGSYQIPEEEIIELKKSFNQHTEWELNPWVTNDHIKKRIYKKKRVVMIEPKTRGRQSVHRSFTIEY